MKISIFIFLLFLLIGCDKPSKKNNVQGVLGEESSKVEIKQTEIFADPDFTEGIYLTGWTVASKKFQTILDSASEAGINTVVFDVKNMDGDIFVNYPQIEPLSRENIKPIIDINDVADALHARNMKAVARIVMFHDQYVAKIDSTLRPQKVDSTAWRESKRRKASWLDSSHPKVQQRLQDLVQYVCKNGVDEIQLDYIRFPTGGKLSAAKFYFQKEDSLLSVSDSLYVFRNKEDIIVDFIKGLQLICKDYGVKLTADVFAIVAWQRAVDVSNTGQNIRRITQVLDAIHPMLYSSHFNSNFGHRENIENEPYYITYQATKLAQKHSECKVIPYIQAFGYRVNYNEEYILSQIEAVRNVHADGYILWNSSSNYWRALRWIRDSKK
ncbi:MAG: family 10 glycosylhydrolase [Candidatus Cloacimonetes bacterium]|jgi:hypothetical protein|nr:family 10 glycosylhydrolase [Candidatus Cloacimonadota bacterium]MBT6994881.1 family 10 glycosylhydrolase [Candidatus Cloacimonadota bacterium]MBT7468996.1 family 10 glycosylhydrolase [Candidatus Cloacimonadota bacterium]